VFQSDALTHAVPLRRRGTAPPRSEFLTNPAVSVVIPTHNRWDRLPTTVAGVLAQQGVEVEVIVVDDASDSPAPEGLHPLDDPRVRLVREETNAGQAHARNRGLGEARGEWTAFLDDDDYWAPDKLRLQLQAARERDAVYVYAAALIVDADLRPIQVIEPPDPDTLARRLLGGNIIPAGASNVVARTELVRELGGFDEELSQLSDWDLWIRIANTGRGASCPEVLMAYVHHPGGAALNDRRDPLAELDRLWQRHRPLGAAHGGQIDRVGFTRWAAGRMRHGGQPVMARRLYARSGWRYRNPGNLARAAGMAVGERAMGRVRRVAPRRSEGASAEGCLPPPPWLNVHA